MKEYLSNGRLWRLCQKELRESLRDRRTIVTLILMPILVYPLLSMGLQRLLIGGAVKPSAELAYIIGVDDEQTAQMLDQLLHDAQRVASMGTKSPIQITRNGENVPNPKAESEKSEDKPAESNIPSDKQFVIVEGGRLPEALSLATIDIAISEIKTEAVPFDRTEVNTYQMKLEFRDGDARSERALTDIRRAMQLLNDFQFESIRNRVSRRLPALVEMKATGIGWRSDSNLSIAGVIPLVLILMTITGAVYPAIDLTAGERERGTMEALIATPAPRFALLLSKYVAVMCVAILTALANLFATWLTLSFGGLGQALLGKHGFSIWMFVQILPLLVIFAAFFSAILLALCSFARSFKEAQAYLIPVMLLSLGPGLITLMPNVQFTTLLGIVPLVNILLLSRDIMTGQSAIVPAFAAVFSTIAYACATLVIAARLFGAESATAGAQESWSDLFGRPKKRRLIPELGDLAIFMAGLFPIFFVTSNVGSMFKLQGSQAIVFNAIVLIVLFLLLPLLYACYRRIDVPGTFRLSLRTKTSASGIWKMVSPIGTIAGVLCLSAGLWMVAFESYLLLESWSLAATLSEEDRIKLKETFADIPFWLVLVTGAMVPAIAEEFFFRGFVLSAFRSKLSIPRSVLFTSLLFAFFHVIAGSILSFEKFLPTIILGGALGILAIRTGALWPGVLLHGLHNGLVFGMSRFSEDELAKWFGAHSKHLPWPWLIGGGISIAFGFLILFVVTGYFGEKNIALGHKENHEDSR